MDAHERADAGAVVELLREDARMTMPPDPACSRAATRSSRFVAQDMFGPDGAYGEFRLVPTRANRQPAAAKYVRRPGDDRVPARSRSTCCASRTG